jgi:hypothetical protein
MLIQKAPSVLLMEDPGKAPRLTCEWLNIQDFYYQDIPRVSAFNLDRPRKVMNTTSVSVMQTKEIPQVYVENIIGAVIVLDLPSRPIDAFNVHWFARFDGCKSGDIRMPTIMKMRLRIGWFVEVY